MTTALGEAYRCQLGPGRGRCSRRTESSVFLERSNHRDRRESAAYFSSHLLVGNGCQRRPKSHLFYGQVASHSRPCGLWHELQLEMSQVNGRQMWTQLVRAKIPRSKLCRVCKKSEMKKIWWPIKKTPSRISIYTHIYILSDMRETIITQSSLNFSIKQNGLFNTSAIRKPTKFSNLCTNWSSCCATSPWNCAWTPRSVWRIYPRHCCYCSICASASCAPKTLGQTSVRPLRPARA